MWQSLKAGVMALPSTMTRFASGVARGEVVFRAYRHDAPLAHDHRLRQRLLIQKV
jgi:hypothetical protein